MLPVVENFDRGGCGDFLEQGRRGFHWEVRSADRAMAFAIPIQLKQHIRTVWAGKVTYSNTHDYFSFLKYNKNTYTSK